MISRSDSLLRLFPSEIGSRAVTYCPTKSRAEESTKHCLGFPRRCRCVTQRRPQSAPHLFAKSLIFLESPSWYRGCFAIKAQEDSLCQAGRSRRGPMEQRRLVTGHLVTPIDLGGYSHCGQLASLFGCSAKLGRCLPIAIPPTAGRNTSRMVVSQR